MTCWLMATAWTVLLALSDGWSGMVGPLTSHGEYFEGIRPVIADPQGWLRTFTEQALHYPTHVAGHPPGPMMVLWALNALGLHGPGWAAALLVAVGTSSVAALAITVRTIANEAAARRMLPFLVLAPLAVWIATTMDALFLGIGAWAIALLATAAEPVDNLLSPNVAGGSLRSRTNAAPCPGSSSSRIAAGSRRRAAGVMSLSTGPRSRTRTTARACSPALRGLAAGALFGALPYLSYGLLPLFAVGLAVLVLTRPGRPVIVAVLAGCAIVPLAFTLLGFWWPDGVHVTQAAYAITGGSGRRSYLYFLVGNIAVLGLLVGPATAYALARLAVVGRDALGRTAPGASGTRIARPAVVGRGALGRTAPPEARIGWLAGAALLGMAVLDVVGVTRGEVERIWLPYAAWVLTAAAVHIPPARRWLAAQAALGIVLQALVLSPW